MLQYTRCMIDDSLSLNDQHTVDSYNNDCPRCVREFHDHRVRIDVRMKFAGTIFFFSHVPPRQRLCYSFLSV